MTSAANLIYFDPAGGTRRSQRQADKWLAERRRDFREGRGREEAESVKALRATRLSQLDRTPPPPLLLDRLDPTESTILFGPGGVGKGALTCSWIVQLVAAGKHVLVLDYEDHGGEWARRVYGLAGADALEAVSWLAPLAEGLGPLWDHASQVRDLIDEDGIDYVVIDSILMACGGLDAMKPEAAIKFFGALQLLGRPSLTIAHVTKLNDPRQPFGTSYFHNLARATWSLMPKGDEVILVCRKANNYLKPQAQAVTTTWRDGTLGEVWEKPAAWSLEDRIEEILSDGMARTPATITAALNEGLPSTEHTSGNSVRSALMRGIKPGRPFTVDAEGRYLLRAAPSENGGDL